MGRVFKIKFLNPELNISINSKYFINKVDIFALLLKWSINFHAIFLSSFYWPSHNQNICIFYTLMLKIFSNFNDTIIICNTAFIVSARWDRWEKGRGSKPDERNNFFSYPHLPDRWHASSHLLGGHPGYFIGTKRPERDTEHLFLFRSQLINYRICNFAHSVHDDKVLEEKTSLLLCYIMLRNVNHNIYKPHI